MTVLVIPGPPVPCGRPRLSLDGHAYMPDRTRKYERSVRHFAKAAFPSPIEGPVRLTAVFYCHNRQRRDVDNLLKSIMDGINGIAFADDSQVVSQSALKLVDKNFPRAVVDVSPVQYSLDYLESEIIWNLLSCSDV